MRRSSGFVRLILATMFVASLVLGACSAGSQTPGTAGTVTESAKPYGSLNVGWSLAFGGKLQDSGLIYDGWGAAIYEGLTRFTPEGQTVPNIAERWEASPDGQAHTFYIRKGIKWHDGSDLTGEDVKFSLERMMDPKSVMISTGEQTAWRNAVASIELKDAYTVVVNLKRPQYEPLAGIDPPLVNTTIVSKKYITEKGEDYFAAHPMGSGPWRVVKYDPVGRLELEAMEDHWRVLPKFKNVTIQLIREEGTRIAMLRTGELDLAYISPDSVDQVKAGGLRIVSHDGASQAYALLYWDIYNLSSYPLGDVRVRRALSFAVDRKELAGIWGGYAEPGAVFYVMPTATFWDPNVLKPDPYDPEGAKKLLAEAGYPNAFYQKVWEVGGGSIATTLSEAIVRYWQQIGIRAELAPVDYGAIRPLMAPGKWSALYGQLWNNVSGGGVWQFEKVASSYRSGPSSRANNPRLDWLIDNVPVTKDPAERKRMMLEAALLGRNEYCHQVYVNVKTLFGVGSQIGEFKPIKGGAALLGPAYAEITHAK